MKVEPSGFKYWKFLTQVVLVLLCFAIAIAVVIDLLNPPDSSSGQLEDLVKKYPYLLMSLLPLLAALEELIFRLPLALFVRKNVRPLTLVSATLLLSLFFGLGHGGWVGVPMQGVMGIVFCIVFLKCGGLEKNYRKAFFSSTFVHFSYNAIAIGSFLLFG